MSIISTLQELSNDEIECVFESEGDTPKIRVQQHKHYRWLVIDDDTIQSLVDVDDPSLIVVPAYQAMLFSLLFVEAPENCLVLGSGGGSLERFLCQYFPQIKLIPIEKSRQIISIARDYFFYPENIAVGNGRADHFLVDFPKSFDLIYCDIFESGRHPDCLATELFHQHMLERLSENGVAAINLLTTDQVSLADVLTCARSVYPHVALYLVPGFQNAVLYVSAQAINKAELFNAHLLQSVMRDVDLQSSVKRIEALQKRKAASQ